MKFRLPGAVLAACMLSAFAEAQPCDQSSYFVIGLFSGRVMPVAQILYDQNVEFWINQDKRQGYLSTVRWLPGFDLSAPSSRLKIARHECTNELWIFDSEIQGLAITWRKAGSVSASEVQAPPSSWEMWGKGAPLTLNFKAKDEDKEKHEGHGHGFKKVISEVGLHVGTEVLLRLIMPH